MDTITIEEYKYMEALAPALYKKINEAIESKEKRVVFFINYNLSPGGIEYYRKRNLNIKLMPYIYKHGNTSITVWKQAIIMD